MWLRQCTKLFSIARNSQKFSVQPVSNSLVPRKQFITPLVRYQHQSVLPDRDDQEDTETREVIKKVNNEIQNKSYGRLFAVVQVCGKQFKITDEDLIVVEGYWAPTVGDKIRLEKVLLVGSANFTLIGRPILPKDQVAVYATVIEKNLSPTILWYVKLRRKRFQKTKLKKIEQTFLRITSIDLNVEVNKIGDVDGLRDRIF